MKRLSLLAPLVLLGAVQAACGGAGDAKGEDGKGGADGMNGAKAAEGMDYPALRFAPVGFPASHEAKMANVASPSATRDGEVIELNGYQVLARSGDVLGEGTFGQIFAADGTAVTSAGLPFISPAADFSSLLAVGDSLYNVTHFESRPGAMYLTELEQGSDGALVPVSTRSIDFAAWDGLWVPCAGSVTPWGNHLGGEEYPPDARAYAEMADDAALFAYDGLDYDSGMYRYFGLDVDTDEDDDGFPDNLTLADVKAAFNPYAYGYPVEVSVSEAGQASVAKHYAMGRVALELAYVMPDEKTVYMSDDGTNVGFFMFIADEAGDLTAGRLYAAKWIQIDGTGAGMADLQWIELGHASDGEVDPFIHGDGRLAFSDIFSTVAPSAGACPDGFVHTIANGVDECLQLNQGMELAASRLETRRYANYLGATMEFRKEEGITFDPHTMTLFVAMSEVNSGMLDAGARDYSGVNDIRVAQNDCGAVYGLDVGPDVGLGSDYIAVNWYPVLAGTPTTYEAGSPYENNACSVNGVANPDNLTFIHDYRTLVIGEDSGTGHQNDAIWSLDLLNGKLTRIMTTPYGSETTSPYWYPNINGFGYLTAVVQHPYGESDEDQASDGSVLRAYTGYLGPFPAAE